MIILLTLLLACSADAGCQTQHICLRTATLDVRAQWDGVEKTERQGPVELHEQLIVKLRPGDGSGSPDYEAAKAWFRALGAAVLGYLPSHSLLVRIPSENATAVAAMEGVHWLGRYQPGYKLAPEWKESYDERDVLRDGSGRTVASVLVAAGSGEEHIVDVLASHWQERLRDEQGVDVELRRDGADTIRAALPPSAASLSLALQWLSEQAWVTWVAPAFTGRTGNMLSSAVQQSGASADLVAGAPFNPARPLWAMGIMGDGQLVGLGDSGVDLLNCYFRDDGSPPGSDHRKVASYRVMPGGDLLDNYGHGSHVAGSIAGQCIRSLADYTIQAEKYNGMAPHAKLAVTDIGVGKNTYLTPPTDLGDYYWGAYVAGARIHSDSWTTADSSYNVMSRSIDRFTFDNPLFLPVFAAGNAGSTHSSAGGITSPAMSKNSLAVGATLGAAGCGVRDRSRMVQAKFTVYGGGRPEQIVHHRILEHSYGPTFNGRMGTTMEVIMAIPGDACSPLQNVATLGGKLVLVSLDGCSPLDKLAAVQVAGGVAALVYNSGNTGFFYMGPVSKLVRIPGGSLPQIVGQMLCSSLLEGRHVRVQLMAYTLQTGDRFDNMASFSSWGPTVDGRLKPEIVAPGERITSAKSSSDFQAPSCGTAVLSGTSMATPITAGGAALIRQYFMEGFYPTGTKVLEHAREPSGALLKAVIISGAMPMLGLNGDGISMDPPPSNNQGYGRIDLANTLFIPGHNLLRLVAVEGTALKSGYGQRHCFMHDGAEDDLKFTLVWHDPPAIPTALLSLVNDLDLTVTDPNGAVFFGNGGPSADRLNNVEQVSIPSPDPGLYVADVAAHHVVELERDGSGQHHAFVARGHIVEVPCLEVRPSVVPLPVVNSRRVTVGLQGMEGGSVRWYCMLSAAIQTAVSHNWQLCGPSHSVLRTTAAEYIAEGLVDTSYSLSVEARDSRYSNPARSAKEVVNFTVDTKPPDTLPAASCSGAPTTSSSACFGFASGDADVDHFECRLLGTEHEEEEWQQCSSPATWSAPADGRYTFQARAVDRAGNVDPSPLAVPWLVHTAPPSPVVTVVSMNSSMWRLEFASDWDDGRPAAARWSCRLDSVGSRMVVFGWRSCVSPLLVELVELEEGDYKLAVRAAAAGNRAVVVVLPVDRTAPIVAILAAPPPLSAASSATFAFQSSDAQRVVQRCCIDQGECREPCSSPASFGGLADGVHVFNLRSSDSLGNSASAAHQFVVDTSPPSVSQLRLVGRSLLFFAAHDGGSGISDCFCRLDRLDGLSPGAWLPCSSPWRLPGKDDSAAYLILVTAQDKANNRPSRPARLHLNNTRPSSPQPQLLRLSAPCPPAFTQQKKGGAALHFWTAAAEVECQENELPPVTGCTSPFYPTDRNDGVHSLRVRLLPGGDWLSCSWITDTQPPTTSVGERGVLVAVAPTFHISGRDNGAPAVTRFECILQRLGGTWNSSSWCRRQVTYGLLHESLYTFSARAVDAAGNADQHPPSLLLLVNYALLFFLKQTGRPTVGSSYRVCDSHCAFSHRPAGHNSSWTIVTISTSGTIVVLAPATATSTRVELNSRPYSIETSIGDQPLQGRLCSSLSHLFTASGIDRQALAVMLRFREERLIYPLLLDEGEGKEMQVGSLVVVHTNETSITSTTQWRPMAAVHRDSYFTVLAPATVSGSYLVVRLRSAAPVPAFLSVSSVASGKKSDSVSLVSNPVALASGLLVAAAVTTIMLVLLVGRSRRK